MHACMSDSNNCKQTQTQSHFLHENASQSLLIIILNITNISRIAIYNPKWFIGFEYCSLIRGMRVAYRMMPKLLNYYSSDVRKLKVWRSWIDSGDIGYMLDDTGTRKPQYTNLIAVKYFLCVIEYSICEGWTSRREGSRTKLVPLPIKKFHVQHSVRRWVLSRIQFKFFSLF